MAGLLLPTDAQIYAFAEHVGQAHSLFKRLPLLPPGQPLRFWIDPHAGCDLQMDVGGAARWVPRLSSSGSQVLLATADYLDRFGHLNFELARCMEYQTDQAASENALGQVLPLGRTAETTPDSPVLDVGGLAARVRAVPVPDLPPALLDWGTVKLSAPIDPKCQSPLCSYLDRLEQHLQTQPPHERVQALRAGARVGRTTKAPTIPAPSRVEWVARMHREQKAALIATLLALRATLERLLRGGG